jgi:uncharacterized protein with HEPN domain
MPKRDADLLIGDMPECCTNIFEFTRGMTFQDFIRDRKTIDAVLGSLGEASKRVPTEIQFSHNQIEWRKMGDFRNVLIHDYFGINYEIVWEIIEGYLPVLSGQLKNFQPVFSELPFYRLHHFICKYTSTPMSPACM